MTFFFFFFFAKIIILIWHGKEKVARRRGVKARDGTEGGKHINQNAAGEIHLFVRCDEAVKHMLIMRGADMSAAGSMCLSSLLF